MTADPSRHKIDTLLRVLPDSYTKRSLRTVTIGMIFFFVGVVLTYSLLQQSQILGAIVIVVFAGCSIEFGYIFVQVEYAVYAYVKLNFLLDERPDVAVSEEYIPLWVVFKHFLIRGFQNGTPTLTVLSVSSTEPSNPYLYTLVLLDNFYGVLRFREEDLVGEVSTDTLSSGVSASATSCIVCDEFGDWRHGFANHPDTKIRNREGITLCDSCIKTCFDSVPETLEEEIRLSVTTRCI